jgi:hypothetical protein
VPAYAPCISTGLITVLYTFLLTLTGIFLLNSIPVNYFQFCPAALILCIISSSHVPLIFTIDPKYLELSTCFNTFPLQSTILRTSSILDLIVVSVCWTLIRNSEYCFLKAYSEAYCHISRHINKQILTKSLAQQHFNIQFLTFVGAEKSYIAEATIASFMACLRRVMDLTIG